MIEQAIVLAAEMHIGQKDKSGEPYIYHPLSVMMKIKGETAKVVAILHDIIEDTDVTLEDLKESGYPEEVVEAIKAITKIPGESYMGYLIRVKANEIALKVKIADIEHNIQLSRLIKLEDKIVERLIKKYVRALIYLRRDPDPLIQIFSKTTRTKRGDKWMYQCIDTVREFAYLGSQNIIKILKNRKLISRKTLECDINFVRDALKILRTHERL